MIKGLLLWFYRLNMKEAAWLLIGCSVLFCWIKMWQERHRWWKIAVASLLAMLMTAIFFSTLGRQGTGDYHIYLIPFHTYRDVMNGANRELYRSNFMNAALFYPAGLLLTALLPKKWPAWRRCLLTVILFAALSAGIEYAQYRYVLGNVEIDDVIHNTAGALAGSLAVLLLTPIINRIMAKMRAWLKNE